MALLADTSRDLLLDSNNDLVITTDLAFSTGLAGVTQACRVALQMFAEEWFLDLDAGIPYWQAILGQKPRRGIQAATLAFRRELEAVIGVLSVLRLEVAYDGPTRVMTVTFQVGTAIGVTTPDTIALNTGI